YFGTAATGSQPALRVSDMKVEPAQVNRGGKLTISATVSGGKALDSFTPCTTGVINFLRYRGDLLESLLNNDIQAQAQSSTKMRHFQKMAIDNCSFEDMRNTGAVGSELFL
ncbi:MAG: hypothetical protein ACHQJ6_07245, partial [Candidatus Berkiellales bacterium]